MLITENRIGDGECFTAFNEQWVNKGNSSPHAGHLVLAQVIFNTLEIDAGHPCHAIVLPAIAQRQRFNLIVARDVDHQCASRDDYGGENRESAKTNERFGTIKRTLQQPASERREKETAGQKITWHTERRGDIRDEARQR